jgi:hypothetical protein
MSVAGDFAQCTDLVGVFCSFETVYKSQTGEKRDGSEDAETAVDQTPERRDATERPGDQSEWNDRDAGDYAELENPLVADGVAQWADERDCNNEMGEGEPVGSIGKEWVAKAVIAEGVMDFCNPKDDLVGKNRVGSEEGGQPSSFMFERKGGEAAEDQAENEERQPEANQTEELRSGFERRCHFSNRS